MIAAAFRVVSLSFTHTHTQTHTKADTKHRLKLKSRRSWQVVRSETGALQRKYVPWICEEMSLTVWKTVQARR